MFPNPSPHPGSPAQSTLVLWVIWFSILSGMLIIMMFAGGGWPVGEDGGVSWMHPVALGSLGALLASSAVRWVVLPKAGNPAARVPIAVVGMALAEGAMIIPMFVLPSDAVVLKQGLYVLAFIGVLAFAPIYMHKRSSGSRDFLKPGE